METQNLLAWILCGTIAGLIGELFLAEHRFSRVLSVIGMGVLGAFGGGLTGYLVFAQDVSQTSGIMASIIGAFAVVIFFVTAHQQSTE